MQCPKCAGAMNRLSYSDTISVQRCVNCCGMLLEPETLLRIREEVRADEFFDIGHPKVGRQMNRVKELRCPVCDLEMVRTRDPQQRHIQFESCPSCKLLFLDAGELLDYSHNTVTERFWDLVKQKLGLD